MASESKPMDIEEEVPEIEDEVKKPEDEGRVPAAEREWEYQREPEAQDIEAPDIFASYRKETLPIFETRRKISNPFKKKKPKKIGKLTWEDDVKTIADHIKEQKEESSKPTYSKDEKHQMDHPDTKEYSFYKSMLEFHDKIVGDPDSEEEPIGAQPTGRGRRVSAAPFKRPRGKKVGQTNRPELLSGKKLPFGKKQPKGSTSPKFSVQYPKGVKGGKKQTYGKGGKRQKPSASPSSGGTGAMAGLDAEYEPKMRKIGGKKIQQRSASGAPKFQKKPKEFKDQGALKPKEEDRKVPRPKKERNTWLRRRRDRKEGKKILSREGGKVGVDLGGKKRVRGGRKTPKVQGAPKIKAWYSEIYGI